MPDKTLDQVRRIWVPEGVFAEGNSDICSATIRDAYGRGIKKHISRELEMLHNCSAPKSRFYITPLIKDKEFPVHPQAYLWLNHGSMPNERELRDYTNYFICLEKLIGHAGFDCLHWVSKQSKRDSPLRDVVDLAYIKYGWWYEIMEESIDPRIRKKERALEDS